jgi:hypothetical protein
MKESHVAASTLLDQLQFFSVTKILEQEIFALKVTTKMKNNSTKV